jgi:hypothetical protein
MEGIPAVELTAVFEGWIDRVRSVTLADYNAIFWMLTILTRIPRPMAWKPNRPPVSDPNLIFHSPRPTIGAADANLDLNGSL